MDIYFAMIYASQTHFSTPLEIEGVICARLGPWEADKTAHSENL